MSNTPNFDAKVKKILDATHPGERVCELTGEKWQLTDEEIGWYRHFNVPPSTLSQRTRWMFLTHFGTGFQWWWNKHFDTGEPVLSFHHPSSGVRVLPDKEWFSRDFSNINADWSSDGSFFDQINALRLRVPLPATSTLTPDENSISLVSIGNKDSFFVLGCKGVRGYYSSLVQESEDYADSIASRNVTHGYNIIHCDRMFNCKFARDSYDCIDCDFIFDCKNCKNCFGASNQRNKKYLWFNEPMSKEEWEKRRKEVDLGCRSQLELHSAAFDQLLLEDSVWPEAFNEGAIDSIGDYLWNCTDCRYCFLMANNSVHNFWCAWGINANGNAFCAGPLNAMDCYMCNVPGYSAKTKFSWKCAQCDSVEYSINCFNCKNCFGCVGLQRKEFHIFNKPFSEDEYWKKLDEIKCDMLDRGEYGRFFPLSFASAHTRLGGAVINTLYNPDDLIKWGAMDFEPCSSGACGFEEKDVTSMRQREDVPDCIGAMGDEWVGASVYDPEAKRRYTFLRPELEFYRQERVPAPTTHFTTRISNLYYVMQSPVFEERVCDKCGTSFTTTVNVTYPNRKIFCRTCYLAFIESRS